MFLLSGGKPLSTSRTMNFVDGTTFAVLANLEVREVIDQVAAFLSLVGPIVEIYYREHGADFVKSILLSALIALLSLGVCFAVGRLWLRGYKLSVPQWIMGVVAALVTSVFFFLFGAADYLQPALDGVIATWKVAIKEDKQWARMSFAKSYARVRALKLEDFTNAPPPEQGGQIIPLMHEESRLADAQSVIQSATENFVRVRPQLGRLLHAEVGIEIPVREVKTAVDKFFATGQHMLPLDKSVDMAANALQQHLEERVEGMIATVRTITVVVPIFVWLALLLWVGWRAHIMIEKAIAH
jgi:hypothetical protein